MVYNQICVATCGNYMIDVPETCDDGNKVSGDGCNSSCYLEAGYLWNTTSLEVYSTCGDGVKVSTETCDDGGVLNGDGCSENCTIETNGHCNTSVNPNVCDICGNTK